MIASGNLETLIRFTDMCAAQSRSIPGFEIHGCWVGAATVPCKAVLAYLPLGLKSMLLALPQVRRYLRNLGPHATPSASNIAIIFLLSSVDEKSTLIHTDPIYVNNQQAVRCDLLSLPWEQHNRQWCFLLNIPTCIIMFSLIWHI